MTKVCDCAVGHRRFASAARGLCVRIASTVALVLVLVSAMPIHAAPDELLEVDDRATSDARVRTYDRAAIEASGVATLTAFLARLPWTFDTDRSARILQSSPRAALDVAGVGPARPRILLDGRRYGAALDGAIDLDGIPLAEIERIEVTLGAGFVEAGAGASAARIDIITRRPGNGGEARAFIAQTESGDGRETAYDFRIGVESERGAIALSAGWLERDAIAAAARPPLDSALPGWDPRDTRAGASSATPRGRFVVPGRGVVTLADGARGCSSERGCSGSDALSFVDFEPATDGYSFVGALDLQAPLERETVALTALQQVGDVAVSATLRHASLQDAQRSAGAALFTGSGPGARISIAADALYNPFGVEIEDARFRMPAPLEETFDDDTLHAAVGLEGAFAVGAHAWAWRFDATHDSLQRDVTRANRVDWAALAAGLGPSFLDASGTPRCGTPEAIVAHCTPINLFDGADGITPSMRAALLTRTRDRTQASATRYALDLAGVALALPHGPLALRVGALIESLDGRLDGDPLEADRVLEPSVLRRLRGQPIADRLRVPGSLTSRELEAAARIPLWRDRARAVEVDIGMRMFDASPYELSTAGHARLRAEAGAGVYARAGWSRGPNAPSADALYRGASDTDAVFNDPCGAARLRAVGETSGQARRCLEGLDGAPTVPPGYEQDNGGYRFTRQGNAQLDGERATERSLGVGWQGRQWPVEVALDWRRLDIADAVGSETVQGTLERCYVGGATTSGPASPTRTGAGGSRRSTSRSPRTGTRGSARSR